MSEPSTSRIKDKLMPAGFRVNALSSNTLLKSHRGLTCIKVNECWYCDNNNASKSTREHARRHHIKEGIDGFIQFKSIHPRLILVLIKINRKKSEARRY
jgi:hypothetical protein